MPPVTTSSSPGKAGAPATAGPPLRTVVATRLAVASGAFCLVLAVALAAHRFQHKRHTEPLDHPRIVELKQQLTGQPANEETKKEIRGLDLQLRLAHDRYLARLSAGQWLLLGGMAVFLVSVQVATWRSKIARPGKRQKAPGWQVREIFRASAAVAALGLGAGAGAWWLTESAHTMVTAELLKATPTSAGEDAPTAAVPLPSTPFPTAEEVARNWGRFRGPGGAGVSVYTNLPLLWDLKTGEGVLWKTRTPGPDFNSPVVWGERLFLTSATDRKREVFCYDAATGKLLWQKAVENVPNGGLAVDLPELSGGHACPTAAADGRRVYAMFANGDVAAFDFNGNLAWARGLGPITNQYGHAASLELWQDRLIVQLDHGESDQKVSRLVALNTADGKTVWEKPRETHGTWSTPIVVVAAGKPQIITLGLPHVIAYAATDGAELWRFKEIEGEITPSPIMAGGLVLAPSPSMKLFAIRPDGTGDVTKTHMAWVAEEGVPDITCPVSDGQRVYLLTTGGMLTSYELKDGKKVWEKELDLEFKVSPSVVGDRLYLLGATGAVVVVSAGPTYKELARGSLGDEVVASPAFADGRMFIRTKTTLYGLGGKTK